MKAKVLCVSFIISILVVSVSVLAEGNLTVDSTPHAHLSMITITVIFFGQPQSGDLQRWIKAQVTLHSIMNG